MDVAPAVTYCSPGDLYSFSSPSTYSHTTHTRVRACHDLTPILISWHGTTSLRTRQTCAISHFNTTPRHVYCLLHSHIHSVCAARTHAWTASLPSNLLASPATFTRVARTAHLRGGRHHPRFTAWYLLWNTRWKDLELAWQTRISAAKAMRASRLRYHRFYKRDELRVRCVARQQNDYRGDTPLPRSR